MIRRTFQLIPRVGPYREKDLWERGIRTWDEFPRDEANVVISAKQDPVARETLLRAEDAFARRDLAALAALIPPREHWRLYSEFASEAAFFDIETDGRDVMRPTVVSLFHRDGFDVFIAGRNMDELPQAMARFPMWVSFNGSVFDYPVLQKHYPQLEKPAVHFDLRFFCKRFGLDGGLKKLEDAMGFSRPRHLRGVNGLDAVLLWRAYRRSADMAPLRLLVEYNLYDSIQLRTLADKAWNFAVEKMGLDEPALTVFERGDVLYDVSKYLLTLAPEGDDLALLEKIRNYDRDLSAM